MSLAATIKAMLAAGCSAEQIAAVTLAQEEERERAEAQKRDARRTGNRARQTNKRARDAAVVEDARNAGNAVTAITDSHIGNESHVVTGRDDALQAVTARDERDVVFLEVPPKDNNQTPLLDLSGDSFGRESLEKSGIAAKADEFYLAYPKRVDPRDAKARFIRLAKSGVDPDRMIAACRRYAEAHRLAGTDKQFIPAPAVWLNRGGYDSEDLPKPRATARPPPSRSEGQFSPRIQAAQDYYRELSRTDLEPPPEAPEPDALGAGGRVVGWPRSVG